MPCTEGIAQFSELTHLCTTADLLACLLRIWWSSFDQSQAGLILNTLGLLKGV